MDKEKHLIPNSTQIPNILLDKVIPAISEAEAKCLLYICRRTYGFHKERDRISLSQFQKGIKNREEKVLDIGAGVSRPAVVEALNNLVGAGIVEKLKTYKGSYFKINLDFDDFEEVVKKVNQLRRFTKSSKESLPKQVKLLNPQNKGNKGNKVIATQSVAGKEIQRISFKKEIDKLIDLFKEVNPAHYRLFGNKTQRKALEDLVKKWGREKVEQTIKLLPQTNQMKYAPTITTPIQLADKLGSLIVFYKKSKIKNKPSIAKIK